MDTKERVLVKIWTLLLVGLLTSGDKNQEPVLKQVEIAAVLKISPRAVSAWMSPNLMNRWRELFVSLDEYDISNGTLLVVSMAALEDEGGDFVIPSKECFLELTKSCLRMKMLRGKKYEAVGKLVSSATIVGYLFGDLMAATFLRSAIAGMVPMFGLMGGVVGGVIGLVIADALKGKSRGDIAREEGEEERANLLLMDMMKLNRRSSWTEILEKIRPVWNVLDTEIKRMFLDGEEETTTTAPSKKAKHNMSNVKGSVIVRKKKKK